MNGEARTARTKQNNPIIPRFHHVINSDEVFGTHSIPQPKVWELVSGGASGFSAERLIHLLNKVGVSVSLAFSEEPNWKPGATFVRFDRESDTDMEANAS